MPKKKTHNLFWNQLLLRSDAIADIKPGTSDGLEQLFAQLATIGEQFDRAFDPADAFEEYVAVTLCQALQRALAQPLKPAAAPAKTPATPKPAAPRKATEPKKASVPRKKTGKTV